MENPIVNFVWMQFEAGRLKPIPSHLFYNIQQNAKQYPDVPFNVWVENPAVTGLYRIPQNVEIRTLDSIDGFSENPATKLEGNVGVWVKIDVARLLVIRHVLENERRLTIYSDMDIKDVRLNASPLQERLSKYGVAFGATFIGEPLQENIETPFENGYLAITERAQPLLDQMIDLCGQIFNCNTIHAVYHAQVGAINKWASAKGILDWEGNIASFPVQPPMGLYDTTPRAELR